MKKSLLLITFLLAMIASLGNAQIAVKQSPNTITMGYVWDMPVSGYPDSVAPKFTPSRVDTLYSKYWINRTSGAYQSPEFYRLGFFNRSSLTIDVNDSASVGLVVKYRTRSRGFGAASAWSAAIITDSLVSTTAGGIVKEWSLVDTDSDLFDAVDVELLIIVTNNAWGIDYTANAAGTLRRKVRLNYSAP